METFMPVSASTSTIPAEMKSIHEQNSWVQELNYAEEVIRFKQLLKNIHARMLEIEKEENQKMSTQHSPPLPSSTQWISSLFCKTNKLQTLLSDNIEYQIWNQAYQAGVGLLNSIEDEKNQNEIIDDPDSDQFYSEVIRSTNVVFTQNSRNNSDFNNLRNLINVAPGSLATKSQCRGFYVCFLGTLLIGAGIALAVLTAGCGIPLLAGICATISALFIGVGAANIYLNIDQFRQDGVSKQLSNVYTAANNRLSAKVKFNFNHSTNNTPAASSRTSMSLT